MLLTQVYAIGQLIHGMIFSILILTVFKFFTQCKVTGPLKFLFILSFLATFNGAITSAVAIYRYLESLDLNAVIPTSESNFTYLYFLSSSVNVISFKKISVLYCNIFNPKIVVAIFVLFCGAIEVMLNLIVIGKYNFVVEYSYSIRPRMLVHFMITFFLNIISFLALYRAAESKSLRSLFFVQNVNRFQIRLIDIFVSILLMTISITFKSIQIATGFLFIDVYLDTFLLVWLLYVHLSQVSK